MKTVPPMRENRLDIPGGRISLEPIAFQHPRRGDAQKSDPPTHTRDRRLSIPSVVTIKSYTSRLRIYGFLGYRAVPFSVQLLALHARLYSTYRVTYKR